MSKIARRFAAPVAAFAVLSLAAAAQAQTAAPAAQPDAAAQARWNPEAMRARMQARRDERLHLLHDALALRTDQEPAWQAFTQDSARPDRGDHAGRRHEESAAMTTPERLDRMARRMGEKQVELQHRADAVKRFYAALDTRQQKAFDALVALRGRRMGGMRDGPHERG